MVCMYDLHQLFENKLRNIREKKKDKTENWKINKRKTYVMTGFGWLNEGRICITIEFYKVQKVDIKSQVRQITKNKVK